MELWKLLSFDFILTFVDYIKVNVLYIYIYIYIGGSKNIEILKANVQSIYETKEPSIEWDILCVLLYTGKKHYWRLSRG